MNAYCFSYRFVTFTKLVIIVAKNYRTAVVIKKYVLAKYIKPIHTGDCVENVILLNNIEVPKALAKAANQQGYFESHKDRVDLVLYSKFIVYKTREEKLASILNL